jgi:hypothetical protein
VERGSSPSSGLTKGLSFVQSSIIVEEPDDMRDSDPSMAGADEAMAEMAGGAGRGMEMVMTPTGKGGVEEFGL